jgi:DNA repair photolyase
MSKNEQPPLAKGRGVPGSPRNRFERTHREADLEQVEEDEEYLESLKKVPTVYIPDQSRSVVSSNDSPDVGFNFSVNPYRGCAHGCSYCYARPTHEYLGLNAGIDFESKILVKHDAPALLRAFLMGEKWVPELIAMSGVTDPYQPCEREFRITRGCLEVMREFQQPVGIITKNAQVTRDLDILGPMSRLGLAHVNVSVTSLDQTLTRSMEPRTSAPTARIRAIRELSAAGVPVRVMVAPIIPGLNDHEVPEILEAVKEAGATAAGFTMIRLPLCVGPIFLDWLDREQPGRKDKVESRIRGMREGRLNTAEFRRRMGGQGEMAAKIGGLFRLLSKKHGLDRGLPKIDCTRFRRPGSQRLLF